jgi:MoaA/NifB/PqqE/SkfB family radical SAM enzyme
MKRIDIKVGFSCNNHCRFCAQGNKRDTHKDKSDIEVKKILEKFKKTCEGVVFTGGEPTIRKELFGWVKYARDLGYQNIQIQTNGRMFSSITYCKKIIKEGANEFAPALHGSRPKIHDYLTRAPGSWYQTVQGIKNLKLLNQRVLLNSVVNKKNYKDLPNLASLLVKLKVDQFQFAFIHINQVISSDSNLIKEIVPKHSEAEPYIKKGLQIGINAGLEVMAEAVPYCLMKGYENYIAESWIPESAVVDADLVMEDYSYYRKNYGKAKGPDCKPCKYYKICEGPWKEYPQIFGWEEFNPIIEQYGKKRG